jgi:hypothetical protein
VRADVYAKSGGMNRRKAGEDFYFLHKVAPLGELMEIKETTVYPSARISNRVPFGTGRAQAEWKRKNEEKYYVYNNLIFNDLKSFVSSINVITKVGDRLGYFQWFATQPEAVKAFLLQENFEGKLERIQKNTSSLLTFQKRFYVWFDGFKVLKFVHFARDHFYPNVLIEEASQQLLKWQLNEDASCDPKELLMRFRILDRA